MMIGQARLGTSLALPAADFAGGGQAVHHRHLHVHQHRVKRSGFHRVERQRAVLNQGDLDARGLEDQARHALVGGVVLGDENAGSALQTAGRVGGGRGGLFA